MINNKNIRLRYSPSPTGNLHIGNARTALFNYLLAKHYNGSFIVRIEDTDIERNIKGSIESQLEELRWLGINPDETIDKPGKFGPYRQLERLEIYNKYINILINKKKAYYCFCTNEEIKFLKNKQLKEGNKFFKYNRKCFFLKNSEINNKLNNSILYSIRFLVPDNHIFIFNDIVRGKIEFNSNDIGDWVLMKSNHIPTYNFAVVIDDILMKISHVIRGEEHISNTPKQLMIYDAYKIKPPIFGHLTLIVNNENKKLSKRDNNFSYFIYEYKKNGYLPEAIFNYISLLGWSPQNNNEIFKSYELIKIFNENRFSKSNSMFDIKKLIWINSIYIKKMTDLDYLNFIKPFLFLEYGFYLKNKNINWVNYLLLLFKNELKYGIQIIDLTKSFFYFFYYYFSFDSLPLLLKESFNNLNINNEIFVYLINNFKNYKLIINFFKKEVNNINIWNEIEIKNIFDKLENFFSIINKKNLYMPIRICIFYEKKGPDLIKYIFLLGKKKVINNINFLFNKLNWNE